MDTSSLNRFIEDLQGLQLQISALEGDIINSALVTQRESSQGAGLGTMLGFNGAGGSYQRQNQTHSRSNLHSGGNQRLQPHFPDLRSTSNPG